MLGAPDPPAEGPRGVLHEQNQLQSFRGSVGDDSVWAWGVTLWQRSVVQKPWVPAPTTTEKENAGPLFKSYKEY